MDDFDFDIVEPNENSTHTMLERIVEQQRAIFTCLSWSINCSLAFWSLLPTYY
jgi:hypothetical protein